MSTSPSTHPVFSSTRAQWSHSLGPRNVYISTPPLTHSFIYLLVFVCVFTCLLTSIIYLYIYLLNSSIYPRGVSCVVCGACAGRLLPGCLCVRAQAGSPSHLHLVQLRGTHRPRRGAQAQVQGKRFFFFFLLLFVLLLFRVLFVWEISTASCVSKPTGGQLSFLFLSVFRGSVWEGVVARGSPTQKVF